MVSFSAFKEMIDDTRSQFDGKVSDLEIACYIFNLLHDDYEELFEEVNGNEKVDDCHCGSTHGCDCFRAENFNHGANLPEGFKDLIKGLTLKEGQTVKGLKKEEKIPDGLLAALEKVRAKAQKPDKVMIVVQAGKTHLFLDKTKTSYVKDIN